jgi:hypothetical protein
MVKLSKASLLNMAQLNNDIVALIDAAPVSPLEAIMVLKLMLDTLIRAFEAGIAKNLNEESMEKKS